MVEGEWQDSEIRVVEKGWRKKSEAGRKKKKRGRRRKKLIVMSEEELKLSSALTQSDLTPRSGGLNAGSHDISACKKTNSMKDTKIIL